MPFTLLGAHFSVSASAEGYGETSPKRCARRRARSLSGFHSVFKVRRHPDRGPNLKLNPN
jgi:hypothetical protein